MASSVETEKEPTCRQLFVERMKRSGREKEWYDRIREAQEKTGKTFNQVAGSVMKDMGYEGPVKERGIHLEYMRTRHKSSAKLETEAKVAEIAAERLIEDFESAVASLPDTASAEVELNWIRGHPAMSRKHRTRDKTKDILVTVEDVVGTPRYARAPSKSAVNALQHWCNYPTEFHKALVSEQKKQTEQSGPGGRASGGDDFSEVERLLMEVRGGAAVKEENPERRSKPSDGLLPDSAQADSGVEADGDGPDDVPDGDADAVQSAE